MKYIDKLNNEFVEEFASKYAKKYKIDIKGFEIKKFPQFFEVNYILNNGDKFPDHLRILINDFAAHSIESFHD